jgi:hypothetical protein
MEVLFANEYSAGVFLSGKKPAHIDVFMNPLEGASENNDPGGLEGTAFNPWSRPYGRER